MIKPLSVFPRQSGPSALKPRLWRHKNGIWYVLYGPRLKSSVSTRFRDLAKAEAFLDHFTKVSHNLDNEPTVTELLAQFLAEAGPKAGSPNSMKHAVASLTRHLGHLQPSELKTVHTWVYTRERGGAPNTVLRDLGVLRSALRHAVLHDRLLVAPSLPNPHRPPIRNLRWLSKDAARRLLAACRENHVKLFVALGFMTAADPTELLRLEWCQVDLERRLIHFGHTTTGRAAVCRINDELFPLLRSTKALAQSSERDISYERVITYRGRPVSSIRTGFRAACKRAGLLSNVTPSYLRQSAAAWMAQAGVPLSEIAQVLGETEETVTRLYGRLAPSPLDAASRALELGTVRALE